MYKKFYLIGFILFATLASTKDYYIITNVSSGLNSILIDSASKGPLSDKQIKTLSKEDHTACVEEDICIEKIIEIDPKAFIFKLDYFKDPSNELYVSLIDLENKYINLSDSIDCYDCSTIELLDKLKSFKFNDGYGSPALIKKSLGFKYQQLTMPEDIVTMTISSNPPAALYVDNKNIGVSPVEISAKKKTQINISFLDINHKKLSKKIRFDKNKELNYDLEPIIGSLYLTSSPSKATILINDKRYGKTPKEITKIKLTESVKITLQLEDHIDEEIYFQPKSEKRENQNVKLNKGQGFLRIKHDGDSEKIMVFSNNKLLGALSKYRNDTIVLDAGKNNVKLVQDDVKKEQSFKISIDAFEDWEVTFVESVDINISF
tara:strand:+ start:2657 stop:3784 length:1128 start_codon:yes stop_codon:yes gene_type:complete